MTTVVISPSEPFGNTPIRLNLHVVTTLQVGTAEVQRLANEFVTRFPFSLIVGKPELAIYEDQVLWRVPLTVSLPGQEDIWQVSELEIDVYTGHIRNETVEQFRIAHLVSVLLKSRHDLENKGEEKEDSTVYPFPQPAFHYLAEIAEDLGIDDLAKNHDHYLYGVEKR